MLEASGLYYPNRLARSFFVAMDDVMGQNGLSSLLHSVGLSQYEGGMPPDDLAKAFDFAALSALNEGLEGMYGQRGGRGIALRIGRAAFAQGMREFGVLRAAGTPRFRALPLEQRVELGLNALAEVLNHFTDQRAHVENDVQSYAFVTENCPFTWGRTSDKPLCHAMVGIVQECLRWVSNGYEFYVRETACRASGAQACVFKINKTAIGESNR